MKPDSYYENLDKRTKEYKEWKKAKEEEEKLGANIKEQIDKIKSFQAEHVRELEVGGDAPEHTGFGDIIENFTKKTGIKKAVEWFSDKTGIDCGCDERKEKLNKLFGYGKKANCMTKEQFDNWTEFKKLNPNKLNGKERKTVANLHAELFNHKVIEPCTCNPKAWIKMIEGIDKIYETYGV
jgi:hypothetical protein